MKKHNYRLLLAVAAIATMFATSCRKNPNPKIEFEDGIYLIGDAVGFANPEDKALFFIGQNEATKELDPKINEKYAWLEAGKTFQIGIVEGGKFRKIGGEASTHTVNGDGGLIPSGAKYFTPKNDGTLSCTETGLYHVIYYTGNPENLIVVTKVDYGIRGELNSWGFTSLGAPTKVEGGVNYRLENVTCKTGKFKLAYNNGWKLPLVFSGDVMVNAETSLGGTMSTLVPGGNDIQLDVNQGHYTVTLGWRVGPTHGFSNLVFTFESAYYPNPAEWKVNIHGSTISNDDDDWQDAVATFSTDESDVTNTNTKAGTYVFNIVSVKMYGDHQFGLQIDGAWNSFADITITGDTANFTGAENDGTKGNIVVASTKTYKVKITLEYSGTEITSKTVDFTEI